MSKLQKHISHQNRNSFTRKNIEICFPPKRKIIFSIKTGKLRFPVKIINFCVFLPKPKNHNFPSKLKIVFLSKPKNHVFPPELKSVLSRQNKKKMCLLAKAVNSCFPITTGKSHFLPKP